MEYVILIVLFSTSFSKSVSKTRMNLLNDLKAPLFAELDVSNVQNYIDTKIDTRLDHINDTLDDKINALIDSKMTVDNLDKTKLDNDERVSGFISNLKSLAEIVKNLTNENNQLKEDFKEWKKSDLKTHEEIEKNLKDANKQLKEDFKEWKKSDLKTLEEVLKNLKNENNQSREDFKEWKKNDFKSLEEIVKNLKNENNQLKEDFTEWKKNDKKQISVRDCSDIYPGSRNGIYQIYPIHGANGGYEVYCDMETDGGGWTVFQRRMNGETDFFRSWLEYQKGFGDLEKEFWLGNDKLHTMTSLYQYELRIGLEGFKRQTGYAKYTTFSIGDASSLYRLSVSGYSGTIGNGLRYSNSRSFSTRDNGSNAKCADMRHGAWWFNKWCGDSNLNGKYLSESAAITTSLNYAGITWYKWKRNWKSLKKTYMMIRRL